VDRRLLFLSMAVVLAVPSCADGRPAHDAVATTSTALVIPATTQAMRARCPVAANVQRFELPAADLPTAALAFEQHDGDTAMCLYRRPVTPRTAALAGLPGWCTAHAAAYLGLVDENETFSEVGFPLAARPMLPPGEAFGGVVEVLGSTTATHWYVLMQVADDVTSGAVQFPGLPSRPLAMHDGMAFAVAPARSDTQFLLSRSTITLQRGAAVSTIDATFSQAFGSAAPLSPRDECLPALPTGESPTDAATARQQIIDTGRTSPR
jgi:hypothetical protein